MTKKGKKEILINGKPVEEYFNKEKTKEARHTHKETQKIPLYKKPTKKNNPDKKYKPGATKKFSKRGIRMAELDIELKNTKVIKRKIICVLLMGNVVNARDIANYINKRTGVRHKDKNISWTISSMKNTSFWGYIDEYLNSGKKTEYKWNGPDISFEEAVKLALPATKKKKQPTKEGDDMPTPTPSYQKPEPGSYTQLPPTITSELSNSTELTISEIILVCIEKGLPLNISIGEKDAKAT